MKWCIRLILLLTSILCVRHYFQKNEQVSAFQEDVKYFSMLYGNIILPLIAVSRGDSLLLPENAKIF